MNKKSKAIKKINCIFDNDRAYNMEEGFFELFFNDVKKVINEYFLCLNPPKIKLNILDNSTQLCIIVDDIIAKSFSQII